MLVPTSLFFRHHWKWSPPTTLGAVSNAFFFFFFFFFFFVLRVSAYHYLIHGIFLEAHRSLLFGCVLAQNYSFILINLCIFVVRNIYMLISGIIVCL